LKGFNLPAFYLGFVFFFVAVMAENNRPPFDFA
jgi:NADH:ubiquinone oxidoreductase subunit H